jgi:hypothetical protein
MDRFTFEELCLMRIFDATNRETLRNELAEGLRDTDDTTEPEVIDLYASAMEKLEALSDEDFTALAVYLNVEDFYSGEEV